MRKNINKINNINIINRMKKLVNNNNDIDKVLKENWKSLGYNPRIMQYPDIIEKAIKNDIIINKHFKESYKNGKMDTRNPYVEKSILSRIEQEDFVLGSISNDNKIIVFDKKRDKYSPNNPFNDFAYLIKYKSINDYSVSYMFAKNISDKKSGDKGIYRYKGFIFKYPRDLNGNDYDNNVPSITDYHLALYSYNFDSYIKLKINNLNLNIEKIVYNHAINGMIRRYIKGNGMKNGEICLDSLNNIHGKVAKNYCLNPMLFSAYEADDIRKFFEKNEVKKLDPIEGKKWFDIYRRTHPVPKHLLDLTQVEPCM